MKGGLPNEPTGEQLVRALEREARRLNIPVRKFIRPLTASPSTWLRQTAIATAPKDSTVERVRALIGGETVAPPPANNFQKSPRREPLIVAERKVIAEMLPPIVDRDPCFRCGVRGDVGCEHRRH